MKEYLQLFSLTLLLGFMFHTAPDSAKISKSSARFVDIIHTAGLWVGTDEPVSANWTVLNAQLSISTSDK